MLDNCFQNSVELPGKSGQKNLYAVNGASSTTSFWNRRYFQSITFSLVPICLFEIKMKIRKYFVFVFSGTGRKPTHDFLSLYSHPTAQQDPLPASQGILFYFYDPKN